tara:strand:- start:83 stop:385 length:303 start_codon:yes stop_codon:yes gene_type:complete
MAFGHQKLTVANSAVGLTVPSEVNYAIMSVETGAMRVRVDGTNPTATIGFLVSAGQELKVFGEDQLNNLKMIRDDTNSAVLNIQYGQTSHDTDHRIDING